jgi:hypothetical protein
LAANAPIASSTVTLKIFALDDAVGVLQWAADRVAAVLEDGPVPAGFSAKPTTAGTLWQMAAYRAIPPDLDDQMAYENATDLTDAAVAAGLPCTAWMQDDLVEHAAQSGTCSDSSVLSIYVTEEDQTAALTNLRRQTADGRR